MKICCALSVHSPAVGDQLGDRHWPLSGCTAWASALAHQQDFHCLLESKASQWRGRCWLRTETSFQMTREVTLRGGEPRVPRGMQVETKRPLVRDTMTGREWRVVLGGPRWPSSVDASEGMVFATLPRRYRALGGSVHPDNSRANNGTSCCMRAL